MLRTPDSIPSTTLHLAMATAARPGKLRNEDLVAAADGLFLVLDGSSVPEGLSSCCDLDAAWYVRRLSAAIISALAGHDDVELTEGLATAIDAVSAEHERTCHSSEAGTLGPSAAVAIVRHRGNDLDHLLLGDVTLLIETGAGVVQHCDRRLAAVAPDVRARIRSHLETGGGYSGAEYRQLVFQLVHAERAVRNTRDGYWIAAADPAAADEALTGVTLSESEGSTATCFALLSDGLARSVGLLGVHGSWADLMKSLQTEGPGLCIDAVRQAEASDPDGRTHPRTSGSDDASGLVAAILGHSDGFED